ncbi:hypothetical protein ACQEUX_20410 [Micromonospora sp. CA-259024]|uniref:hypothetical protein n=1 Tax=Micromonospora sp. CA-259024 TaxID=3239965 RepID=UPI003D8E12DE
MPARRNPKKSRSPEAGPTVEELTPANLDQAAIMPAVPPLPIEGSGPALRSAPPTAGPPVARGRSAVGHGSQRAGQARRYAFRRS